MPRAVASCWSRVPAAAIGDALVWVECELAAERTVAEIASSSERISALIASVKTYSHMDRSSEHKPTDVRVGLDNTLTMLGHKIGQRSPVKVEGIQRAREYIGQRLGRSGLRPKEQSFSSRGDLGVNLVVEIEDRLHDPERVASELRLRLGLKVEVQAVALGSLPRVEGKGKRFVDQRCKPTAN